MSDTEGNTRICILDNLFVDILTHPPKGKEKSIIVYKFQNYFPEKKLPLIENLSIKSLNYFKHQISKISVILYCGSFFWVNGVLKILQYFLGKLQHSVRSIFSVKLFTWYLWFCTNTWTVLLIKLQALALVTLVTYINYITSILLIIFWYYLLAPIANYWKRTHQERYVHLPLEQRLL